MLAARANLKRFETLRELRLKADRQITAASGVHRGYWTAQTRRAGQCCPPDVCPTLHLQTRAIDFDRNLKRLMTSCSRADETRKPGISASNEPRLTMRSSEVFITPRL